jgi:hypothetical protein
MGDYYSRLKAQSEPAAAPAPAPPPSARTTNAPTSLEISRVLVGDVVKEIYTIIADDTIEEAFGHVKLVSGLIYVCGGVTNGVPDPAQAACYLGRTAQHLTEVRNVGDENVPVLINETVKSELQSGRTYLRGKAGDKLVLLYR